MLGLLLLPAAREIAFTQKGQYADTYPLKILEVIDFKISLLKKKTKNLLISRSCPAGHYLLAGRLFSSFFFPLSNIYMYSHIQPVSLPFLST